MCDAKPNQTATVKADNRRYKTGPDGKPITASGQGPEGKGGVGGLYDETEVDPTITDENTRERYGLAPKKGPGLDLTDKALRDARMNEAMRLRARRGRKASFLQSDMDWSEQKTPGFKQTTQDGVGGSWDL